MAEIVTGMPAAVGFTSGYSGYKTGWSGKDMQYASAVDRGEQTRDLLAAISATNVAVEKTGAAGTLATEKTGAAAVLVAEKIGAANTLAVQLAATTMMTALKDCCCELSKEVADVKAAVLSVDAQRIRDDLAETRAELLALRTSSPGHGGASRT